MDGLLLTPQFYLKETETKHDSKGVFVSISSSKKITGISLVVQWLRIHLAMQGTQVQSLVGELRSHMPWSNSAHMPSLSSPHTTTRESAHHSERLCMMQPSSHVPQLRLEEAKLINKYLKNEKITHFTVLLLLFSRPVMSDSLRPHELQPSRSPCPLPSSGVCQSSHPLLWRCHPPIPSSDALFSFCPQSFQLSGSFPMSQLFASGDQNTGASASASVLQ